MKVLLTDTYLGEPSFERALLDAEGIELLVAPDAEAETLASFEVDGVLNCVARVPKTVITAIPGLKVIARYGIGVDNIDLAAATEAGVLVCNVPDYSIDEVATHALGMILSFARQLHVYHDKVAKGSWEWRTRPELRRTSNLTVGVVGFGRIGSLLANKAKAVGFEVIAHDALIDGSSIRRLGVEPVSLEQLLERSDFVSLHVPLTTDTTHLMNEATLALMRPNAYLINAGRGKLVDSNALLHALESDKLAGAGLDVFEDEPLPADSPLKGHPKVLHTPHSAWFSMEALDEAREKAVANVVAALRGTRPKNLVNPEVLERGMGD